MKIQSEKLYHVYNQGNNKELIFGDRADYLLFLEKVKLFLAPEATVLAYCLMPNHFHFLLETTKRSCEEIKIGSLFLTRLTNAFRLVQSNYAQIYNKKYARTGSLFRQKTKFKELETSYSAFICFHYIHQNPIKAQLVMKLEDWEFSSFKDFANIRSGLLPNKEHAFLLLEIDEKNFVENSYKVISPELIEKLGLE